MINALLITFDFDRNSRRSRPKEIAILQNGSYNLQCDRLAEIVLLARSRRLRHFSGRSSRNGIVLLLAGCEESEHGGVSLGKSFFGKHRFAITAIHYYSTIK